MEIKSLEKTDFNTLFRAFGRAFADYEVQLNAEQLRAMLTRRGFDPALSFAAFDGAQIAAFTLNGQRFHLTANEGKNQLHGGLCGFDKKEIAAGQTEHFTITVEKEGNF